VSFIRIFIDPYNCFTADFTVEFTIAINTPIYNQYLAIFFARRYISEKSAWGRATIPYTLVHCCVFVFKEEGCLEKLTYPCALFEQLINVWLV